MLNKKPTYSHQPIYQPGKKKKKTQKKILYLILAIALVIIVLFVVVLISIKKVEDISTGSSIEEVILNEVQLNSVLREEVLNTNGIVWWEDLNFPPQTKEKIQSMTPYFIECIAKICEISNLCFLTEEETNKLNLSEKKVYSESIMISSDQAEKNKIFRIFCWGVVEKQVGEDIINDTDIIEPFCGDGNINTGELCDGSAWGSITGCTNFNFTGGILSCRADCQFDTSFCTGGVPGVCNDGNINTGELCDGSAWGSITGCTNFNFTGGILSCRADCQFDTSLCTGDPGGYCTDGNINTGEQCDGSAWGSITGCTNFNFTGGTLNCGADCQFDTSFCTGGVPGVCNDGNINIGEQCDGSAWGPITGCTNFNFTGGTLNCGADCQFDTSLCTGGITGVCNDENINIGEQCDGTNLRGWTCQYFGYNSGNLSCNNDCTFDFSECIGCILEFDETFCSRYGKNCGIFSETDNCGNQRTVNCGSCTAPETCGGGGLANVCGEEACVPETDQEFCSRYEKDCGVFLETDNCEQTRTVNCGSCTAPETCVDNACGGTCQSNCGGKCGGANGCGGTCPNTCTGGLVCKAPNYKFCGPKSSVEFLGRGLVALPKNNGIYLGWRLLPWDNQNIGFNVYRATNAGGPFTKINSVPIKISTNYYHSNVQSGTYYYMVRTVDSSGVEGSNSNLAKVTAGTSTGYISVPLSNRPSYDNANDVAERMPADLNGDGVMDFVLQLGYIHKDKSDKQICDETTSRIEAIISNPDGTWSSAWKVNTGFKDCAKGGGFLSAWDLTGDGKAEVITRWGSGGNLAVLSGSDGSLIAVKPWPHWDKLHAYLTIALLEDVTGDGIADPFIVVASGGYGGREALYTAYRLEGNSLVEKRRIDIGLIREQTLQEDEYGKKYWGNSTHPSVWGIGTHGLVAVDLTGDGFDEVVPCGSIFYPDWSGYWRVNSGHCDGCFAGDLDPSNPGAEVFMACEKPRRASLVLLTPGQKPEEVWRFTSDTYHDHHRGFHKAWCGDISVAGYSGMACIGYELDNSSSAQEPGSGNTRVFTIPGLEITNNYNWPFRMWMRWPIDWNKGDQSNKILLSPKGYQSVADLVGDSREEQVTYDKNTNTLRISTNTNLLNTRHVTPLADRGYRSGVARQGGGYPTVRILMKTNQPRLDIVPGL